MQHARVRAPPGGFKGAVPRTQSQLTSATRGCASLRSRLGLVRPRPYKMISVQEGLADEPNPLHLIDRLLCRRARVCAGAVNRHAGDTARRQPAARRWRVSNSRTATLRKGDHQRTKLKTNISTRLPRTNFDKQFLWVSQIAKTTLGVGYGGQMLGSRVVRLGIEWKRVDESAEQSPLRAIGRAGGH
jgi:hypothetical protein